jgi:antibiotic biosynthesis monooxygenase (ABM) superfamily enzyme
MEFVQIIEYQTSKPDEMKALGDDIQAARADDPGFADVTAMIVKDRDRENTYMTIVRFPSYEMAMENSQRDDTNEMAAKMAALCDGPPTFRNLDVVGEM